VFPLFWFPFSSTHIIISSILQKPYSIRGSSISWRLTSAPWHSWEDGYLRPPTWPA
jgi:phosphate/sulfate permease